MSDAPAAEPAPIEEVRQLLISAGVAAQRLRVLIRLLMDHPSTPADLITQSAIDRRTVQSVLAALGSDLVETGHGRVRIADSRIEAYRELIDRAHLVATQPVDAYERQLAQHADLVAQVQRWIEDAPRPRQALDHVSATAQTVVRRALWLDSTFTLKGARLLCLGDHDLTSLAVAKINSSVEVMVVDVDDDILAYIDARARPSVRCLWSDFRFGLARSALEWADVVFTDPPYTPDGVRLFLTRGLAGLRDRDHARLVMAYGFGENQPGLALKVQRAITGLHLAYEAVLPDFNRYHGAQAIGSSSDLYVLRPTAGTWTLAESGGSASGVNIYTHGRQSVEGETGTLAPDIADAVRQAAQGPGALPLAALVGPGWPPITEPKPIALGRVFVAEQPSVLTRVGSSIAMDLTGDPGSWLARTLLAVNTQRVAILIANNHPDVADEAAQRHLTGLLAAKYRLRLRRSTPGPRYAIVEADLVDIAGLDPPQVAVRGVLDRALGKVGNTWRESLVRATDSTLTKNEARARVRTATAHPEALDAQLITLPEHTIAALSDEIAGSVLS
jgi:predicted methyltransferase